MDPRVEAGHGCPVLLFTVDLPVPGSRYRDVHSGLHELPDPAVDLLVACRAAWMRRQRMDSATGKVLHVVN